MLRRCWIALWWLLLVPVWAREVKITVLHTTDLHGQVQQLARCATVIRQVRDREPHVFLVDNGDTIQGTAVSWLTGGEVMIRAMNAMRYDAWILGNHEFDWGLGKLTNCIAHATMPVLAANAIGLARVQPFLIRHVEDIKVAIIGLTTPGIPNWSRPRLIPGLQFADSLETLRRVLPAARAAGAKVFVLVVHQGYKESGDDHANQIRAIASRFPELDLIIGGHTHRQFDGLRVSNILYTQAGFHGQYLGRVDLVFDTQQQKVVSRRSRTIPIDERVAADETISKLVQKDLQQSEKYLQTSVGTATDVIPPRGGPKRETPIHNLICEAIGFALKQRGIKPDAVVHGLLSERESLSQGTITIADVWRIIPYENTIGVAYLRPSQLREILEENLATYNKREFRGLCGLRWRFDPFAPVGSRLLTLTRPDGRVLCEEERLAVAFNSYELASGGLRWVKLREIANLPDTHLNECDLVTREVLLEYIQSQQVIAPKTNGWWEAVPTPRKRSKPLAH